MKLRTQIILVTCVTLTFAAALFGIATFQAERKTLILSMDDKLLATATMAKEILPADYHDKIAGPDSISETEYLEVVKRWDRLCKQLGLEYIWSLMLVDGKPVFTSGSSTSKDVRQGDYARFFEKHSNPEFYTSAFQTLQPQHLVINDKWGRIKVVLMPFTDGHGRPCLIGTSMKMTEIDALMRRTIKKFFFLSLGVLLLAIVPNIGFARSLARPLETLTNLTKSIREGNWGHVVVTSGAQEIKTLGQNINVMSRAIQNEITRRNQAETTLRESEEKYRFMTENSSDVIWHLDSNYQFDYVNSADERLRHFKREEVIGKTIWSLFMPEAVEQIKRANAQRLAEEQKGIQSGTFRYELEQICKDGHWIWTEVHVTPHRDATGKIIGYHGVTRDISERKHKESEQIRLQKLESLSVLAGGIAHDFNNILMGLFGNIELAQETLSKDHPAYLCLSEASKSMKRATRLTKQLLTFAKGGDPIKACIAIGPLVEEVALFDLAGSRIKLVFHQAKDLWRAEIDKGQIEQAISNLIIHSRQSMTHGGNLYVTLENVSVTETTASQLRPGRYVRGILRDEGPGIDPSHLDHVFDPYFTVKPSANSLALAATHSVITRHGGHIDVASEVKKGATFTFLLPACDAPEDNDVQRTRKTERLNGKPHKILVMDDELTLCTLVAKMLARCGYSAVTVPDGRQAIDAYRKAQEDGTPFAAVILDLTVPGGLGGKDAIRSILEIDPQAKGIVSSGYADDPVMANYSTYGFKGIVAKPYTQDDLRDTLLRVLG